MPREFGTIYRVLGDRGYPASDVDAMEVWHVASLLGVGEPERTAETAGPASSGRDRAVERMRAAAEGRPPPEPAPMDPAAFAVLAGELAGG